MFPKFRGELRHRLSICLGDPSLHYVGLNKKDPPARWPRGPLNLNLSLRVLHTLARGTFNFAAVP